MFQCVEDLIERLDRLLSLGGVHPFEKAFDEGTVLQGMLRAPLVHRMRIAPLVTAVARLAIDSGAITRDSTSLQSCSGYEARWCRWRPKSALSRRGRFSGDLGAGSWRGGCLGDGG